VAEEVIELRLGGLMSLSFRPNRAVSGVAGGVVWFIATDGPLLVRCGVLKEALAAIHHLQTERPEIPEQVFQRHRERIQESQPASTAPSNSTGRG